MSGSDSGSPERSLRLPSHPWLDLGRFRPFRRKVIGIGIGMACEFVALRLLVGSKLPPEKAKGGVLRSDRPSCESPDTPGEDTRGSGSMRVCQ